MSTAKIFKEAIEEEQANKETELSEGVGTLVFQSALMYYLAAHDETEADKFEKYVTENVTGDNFLEDLCFDYPEFEQILLAEMKAFQQEVLS